MTTPNRPTDLAIAGETLTRQPDRELPAEEQKVLRRVAWMFAVPGAALFLAGMLFFVAFLVLAPRTPGWQSGLMVSTSLLGLVVMNSGGYLLLRTVLLVWDSSRSQAFRFAQLQSAMGEPGSASLEILPRSRVIWRRDDGPVLPLGPTNRLDALTSLEDAEVVFVRRIAADELEAVHQNRRTVRLLTRSLVLGCWGATWFLFLVMGTIGSAANSVALSCGIFLLLTMQGAVEGSHRSVLEQWRTHLAYQRDRAEGIGLTFVGLRHSDCANGGQQVPAYEVLLHSGLLLHRAAPGTHRVQFSSKEAM